jgi:hypothetical protein
VLPTVRVEVKSRGVRHVTTGIVRNDRDIVAYLVLVRIAFEGIKRIAYRHIRRPGHASVSTKGIEQL